MESLGDSSGSFPPQTGYHTPSPLKSLEIEERIRSDLKISNGSNASNVTAPTASLPKSMDVTTSMNSGTVFAADTELEGNESWKRTGLYVIAGTLSVAFMCMICVCIPCFLWKTKRKSKLNLKSSEFDAHRHHDLGGYHARIPSNTRTGRTAQHIHVVDQSILDEDTVDGIYGPGPAAVTTSG